MRAAVYALTFLLASLFLPDGARADNRALLIGASGYPAAIGELLGPGNDVQAMWELLAERGFNKTNVRVVADRLNGDFAKTAGVACAKIASDADCPRYAVIERALAELVAAARTGDYVVIYFSGHGVQIPDLVKRDEPDGLTEAFVPLDVGRWDSARKTVTNLLTDDALGDAIEKLRAKGAFVWAIFDTCHAGDMTRSGTVSYSRPRKVDGSVLGIPDAAFAEAQGGKQAAARKGASLPLKAGGLVGYFAAQSDQLALELDFNEQDASGKPTRYVMGGLTHALRRALAQDPNPTYRQLAQRIVEIYGNLGADMPAPYFEGDLDKAVFSDKAAEPTWAAEWRGGKLAVAAGELFGISEGAVFALLAGDGRTPAAPAIGYARAEKVTARSSEAVAVEFAGKAPLTSTPGAKLRARLERPGVRGVLRVALPPAQDGRGMSPERSGRAAIEHLRAMPAEQRSISIEWVDAGQPADMHLRLEDGRIWLLTPYGDWLKEGTRQSPSIDVRDRENTAGALQENLWRASRALNLQRLAGGYRQSVKGIEGAVAGALKIDLYRYRDPRASPDRPACPPEPAIQGGAPKDAQLIAAGTVPEFRHCDIVYVVMRNTGNLPVDVTLLYIEAEAKIQCFRDWGKARIDPGEVRNRVQAFRVVTRDPTSGAPSPVGREHLLIIGVEKRTRDEIETTYCQLQQDSLDSARMRGGTRGAPAGAFSALMEQAGLGLEPQTRGFTVVPPQDLGQVLMRTFNWDVKDPPRR